jgi:tetratricopeptide (TPR) repeat protein
MNILQWPSSKGAAKLVDSQQRLIYLVWLTTKLMEEKAMRSAFTHLTFASLFVFLVAANARGQSACQQAGLPPGCNVHVDGHAPNTSSGSPAPSNIGNAWGYYGQGMQYFVRGDYANAIQSLEAAKSLSHRTLHLNSAGDLQHNADEYLQLSKRALNAQAQGSGQWQKYLNATDLNQKGVAASQEGRFNDAIKYYTQALIYYPDTMLYQENLKSVLERMKKWNSQEAAQADHYSHQAISQSKVLSQRENSLDMEYLKLKANLDATFDQAQKSNIQAKMEHIQYARNLSDKATKNFVDSWGDASMGSAQNFIEIQKLSDQAFQEAMQDARNLVSPSPWLYNEPHAR